MRVPLQRVIKDETADLTAFLRDFLSFKKYVMLLGLVSLLYILVILFYTHGALLFDGNFSGFYHLIPGLFTTPSGILQGISLLISQGNIYVAYYVYLYLSILSLLIASFYLSLQILSKFVPKDILLISSAVAASLSFIEPFVLTDYYSSLLGNGWVYNTLFSSSLFTLFLAFLFRSYSSVGSRSKFLNSILLSGSFLGLSVAPFPNDVRIIFIGYLLFAAMLIFLLISSFYWDERVIWRTIFLSIVAFIIASFVFSLFDIYPMLSISGLQHYYTAASTNGATSGIQDFTGNFNTIPQVIRLLGVWPFTAGFDIYSGIYYGINVVNISSYFWPLLALFFPLVFAYKVKENRGLLLFIMVLVLLSIFYEKGSNPPLGSLWLFVTSKIPFGYEFMSSGFLQYYVMGTFYPVLATLSIVTIYIYLKKMKIFRLRKKLSKVAVLVPVALVVVLIVAEMPVFDGQIYENFWAPKSSGFFIPGEYEYARDYLLSYSQNVLLFPGVGPWITTSWNYSGSSQIYYNFFQPVNVTNVYVFSGTPAYTPSNLETCNLLDNPFLNGNNLSSLSTEWLHTILNLKIGFIIFDSTLSPNQVLYNYTYYLTAIHLLVLDGIASLAISFKNLKIYKINESKVQKILEGSSLT
jgi:hypothetical protein